MLESSSPGMPLCPVELLSDVQPPNRANSRCEMQSKSRNYGGRCRVGSGTLAVFQRIQRAWNISRATCHDSLYALVKGLKRAKILKSCRTSNLLLIRERRTFRLRTALPVPIYRPKCVWRIDNTYYLSDHDVDIDYRSLSKG